VHVSLSSADWLPGEMIARPACPVTHIHAESLSTDSRLTIMPVFMHLQKLCCVLLNLVAVKQFLLQISMHVAIVHDAGGH